MFGPLCRRVAGTYLALFFLAVAAAPHHHLNGLEDLLLDQRSDSGYVVEGGSAVGTASAPAWNTFAVLADEPCLACFNGDYVFAPTPVIAFTPSLDRLTSQIVTSTGTTPPVLSKDTPSRAPPAAA